MPGVPANLANIGLFTGISGSNSVQLPRSYTSIGADTQLLGNFEYRIPILSDKFSAALFTDIGTAFNLRSKHDQFFSSNFLDDQPFLRHGRAIICARVPAGAAALPVCQPWQPATATHSLALIGQWYSRSGHARQPPGFNHGVAERSLIWAPSDPFTGLPFGFQQVFLRGQAQTNTAVRLSQALFSKFGDYRASMGLELRIQVPVINVPFRLIFAYNPNARKDQVIDGFPFFFQREKSGSPL